MSKAGNDALEAQKRKHNHTIEKLAKLNPILCPEPTALRGVLDGLCSLLEMDVIRIEREQSSDEKADEIRRGVLTRVIFWGIRIGATAALAAASLYFIT